MSRARKVQIYSEAGIPHALVLEADFVGEHQMGVDPLLRELKIPLKDPLGIEGRSMQGEAGPDLVRGGEFKIVEMDGRKRSTATADVLVLWDFWGSKIGPMDYVNNSIGKRWNKEAAIIGGYSSSAMGLVAYGDAERAFVRDLRSAIEQQDFALWSGRFTKNPFDPGGLAVAIPSRVPVQLKDRMREHDEEGRRLVEAAAKTGIESRVMAVKSPRGWSMRSLSPRWAASFKDLNGRAFETAHPVVFFFSANGEEANYGWYTVEELDQWIEGKGPAMARARERSPAGLS